ncbi:MAG: hypothetical protein JSW33_06630 [bacterium]|nr:MAG: hypothetical protein JSW33_06630 [bacterium]
MIRIITFTFLIISVQFVGCTDDGPDLGIYYQKSFVDSVVTVIYADSIHIIIEEFGPGQPERKNIAYEFENQQSLDDTIKLILHVNFGSYSPIPDPIREIKVSGDTLYLWYASRQKPDVLNLHKFNSGSILGVVDTSPRLDYYSIEEAIIQVSASKKISLETRFYE